MVPDKNLLFDYNQSTCDDVNLKKIIKCYAHAPCQSCCLLSTAYSSPLPRVRNGKRLLWTASGSQHWLCPIHLYRSHVYPPLLLRLLPAPPRMQKTQADSLVSEISKRAWSAVPTLTLTAPSPAVMWLFANSMVWSSVEVRPGRSGRLWLGNFTGFKLSFETKLNILWTCLSNKNCMKVVSVLRWCGTISTLYSEWIVVLVHDTR